MICAEESESPTTVSPWPQADRDDLTQSELAENGSRSAENLGTQRPPANMFSTKDLQASKCRKNCDAGDQSFPSPAVAYAGRWKGQPQISEI